jgi:hypothetical protein
MPFSAKVSYIPLLDPTQFNVVDASVYLAPDDKANISSRTLQILDSLGNALPNYPNPIAWPIGGTDTLNFTGLTKDLALQIIMTLVPVTPQAGSVYIAETDVATVRFEQQGLFNIQVQRLNDIQPSSLADQQYRQNSIDLIIEANNAQIAITYANYTGAQLALNRTQSIINNTTL